MALLRLDAIQPEDRPRVGGKAFVLAQLRRRGFPVPDGFVLCAGTAWDTAARAEVAAAYAVLGGAVAVRSSSTAEDLDDASFAGQYATFLDVRGEGPVLDAVGGCLGSAERGSAYAALVANARAGAMAVLVQRFVEPLFAGVAFTRSPADASAMLVESHAGRGEELVSGRVTPVRHVVDRGTLALRTSAGGLALPDASLAAIVEAARAIETLLAAPQDVEWAIGSAGLALLQSRPITVAAPALDPKARRLTRANVGEVLPDAVTPLTWSGVGSLLEAAFLAVAGEANLLPADFPGSRFLVLYRRRVYLNLSLCMEVGRRLPGLSPADAERLILGAGAARNAVVPTPPLSAWPWLAGVAARLVGIQQRLPGDVVAAQSVVARLPDAGEVASASRAELARLVADFLETGRSVARTHIAASGASAFRLALLTRAAGWLPGDPADLVNRFVAGLPDIESAAPTLALEALAARVRADDAWRVWLSRDPAELARSFAAGEGPKDLREALCAFLVRYGHRAVSEGELSAASWRDDPTPVFAALLGLIAGGRPAGFGHRARAADRRQDEAAARSRLSGWRRGVFAWALDGAQSWVREREKTKSLAIALVAHGRRLARAAALRLVAAGELAHPDDVYLLSLDELRAALDGKALSTAELGRRRRRQEREAALPAPREIDFDAPADDDAVSESWLGLGASPGVGIGKARVIVAGGAWHVEPGEILVTPVLDAALGPLLASTAGAVAEIGGTLSHGSVVARELGIPCVVDLRDATRRIRTGDLVRVDGSAGRVDVLAARVAPGAEALASATLHEVVLADPADERLHPFGPEPSARESVYFNAYDPRAGLGVIASMGVKPGGRGESVLALALPDGRALFGLSLASPTVDAAGFAVGGVGTTWGRTRLSFRGRLAAFENAGFPPAPLPLVATPRTVEVELELAFRPDTPAVEMVAALPAEAQRVLAPLGAHHVEQSGLFEGQVTIDGARVKLLASGSRDHSWGRREWSAADHWRLFAVRFGDDLALHAISTSVLGRRVAGGFVWRGGRLLEITRIECAHEPGAAAFELEVQTRTGERFAFAGAVENTLLIPVELSRRPLRHLAGRPYALVLHENFARFTGHGRVGHGIAEFALRP